MSCQIKLTANINDVPAVRRHLFPTDDNRGSENWLQTCEVSLSPTGDIMALAYGKRLVVLTGKWDTQSSTNQFHVSQDSCLADFKDNIRAVLCLPIVVQSQSSQVGSDWTCIVVGFDSGMVSFLTETCTLLLEEQLHNESIIALKCQSQHSPRPDISPELKSEELYVIYASNVCVVAGVHLFSILRSCRTQLARGMSVTQSESTTITGGNLKKWGFAEQATVNDVGVVGLDLSNTFNHLLTASICGGFESKYRAMPPHNSLVLGAGSKPFVGFHYALEGGNQPVLSDVAKAVASKLKSALPGWLTGNKSAPDRTQSISMQPVDSMACRFGLCDLRRSAYSVILSPDKKLAIVCDDLGRVMLIDTHRGVALRIFKGYRDAQCAFVQVPDERKSRSKTNRAIALFLIIYSAKKGTLELFCLQQVNKVATFTASKNSRLLYINYGLMGFQNTSKSRYICQYTCVLMDPDGKIKEIVIPFHFALTEKNSKRARDLHLLKRLKQFIKGDNCSPDKLLNETWSTCQELKTVETKSQFLELLYNSKEISPEVLIKCAEYFLQDESELDQKQLKLTSQNLLCLSKFYQFVSTDLDSLNGNVGKVGMESRYSLPKKDMNNLQRLLDLSTLNDQISNAPKVTFGENKDFSVSGFISSFDHNNEDIQLKSDLTELKLFQVSERVFARYVSETGDYGLLEESVRNSCIPPKDLFHMLLHYWVHRPLKTYHNLETEMENFSCTIIALIKTISSEDIQVQYNEVSPFWNDVRNILLNSAKPFPALTAAILCKSVAQNLECDAEEENFEIWEKLSQENCLWTLLIGKLEDVSLLNIIVARKPVCDGTLPKLYFDFSDVSLKIILEKGRGSVSETVAQWLTTGGLNPKTIILNDLNKSDEETSDELKQQVFQHLNILRKQFPHSLEPSVLLANMCWEYALAWQRDIKDLGILEASIKCLTQIPNLHLKSGLYNLVWTTHLKIIFESVCKLINKVGKLPIERLCRQETDLSDYQITIFLEICTDFFDTFMEILYDSYHYERPSLQYEAIWENGGTPLAELVLTQNEINYDILLLHYQLSLALHMIAVFSIKHTKMVSNLFDSSVIPLFFTDTQQKLRINWQKHETKVNASRLQFLIKVIAASLETVTITEDKIYSADHVSWMSKCVALARFWNVEVDLLKRYQVSQLFFNGLDKLGAELLQTVTEKNKLGPDLVTVAGKRLELFLSSSQVLGEKLAAFSTKLTAYLSNLDGDPCAPSDLNSIIALIVLCLNCLEETQPEHAIATLMLESCTILQDLD